MEGIKHLKGDWRYIRNYIERDMAIKAIKLQRKQDYDMVLRVLKEVIIEKRLDSSTYSTFKFKYDERLKNLKEE